MTYICSEYLRFFFHSWSFLLSAVFNIPACAPTTSPVAYPYIDNVVPLLCRPKRGNLFDTLIIIPSSIKKKKEKKEKKGENCFSAIGFAVVANIRIIVFKT